MDTFSIIRRSLEATEADPDKVGLDARVVLAGRVLTAVQTVVDTLTPPDGGRYVVAFSDISTAATSLGERRIIVSSKPLHDASLSMVEKAVVIATFAAHEIGHTYITGPRKGAAREHNAFSGYHAVANLADDIILEPWMADRYPILTDAFEFTGQWVLRTTSPELPKVFRMSKSMSTPDRFNVLLNATRYGDIADIVFADSVTKAERDWSRDWAKRLIALRLTDHAGYLALCDEAWERIRTEADEEPLPEDEPEPGDSGDEGEPDEDEGDESDDDESGEGSEGEDGEDESDEGDEGDGESESDDEGDEDGESGESEGEDEGDGASEESDEGAGSEDGESEGEGASEGDEATDGGTMERPEGEQPDGADWDDDDEDGESEGETSQDDHTEGSEPEDENGAGGGGNAEADKNTRSESDWDKRDVEQTMHDQIEPPSWDYNQRQDEQAVRTYASTTVTSFGHHGSIQTEWS